MVPKIWKIQGSLWQGGRIGIKRWDEGGINTGDTDILSHVGNFSLSI